LPLNSGPGNGYEKKRRTPRSCPITRSSSTKKAFFFPSSFFCVFTPIFTHFYAVPSPGPGSSVLRRLRMDGCPVSTRPGEEWGWLLCCAERQGRGGARGGTVWKKKRSRITKDQGALQTHVNKAFKPWVRSNSLSSLVVED
jgi:hypothetical protein